MTKRNLHERCLAAALTTARIDAARRILQNKANPPFAALASRSLPECLAAGDSRRRPQSQNEKTNPTRARRILQNKANPAFAALASRSRPERLAAGDSRRRPQSQNEKTNPIPARAQQNKAIALVRRTNLTPLAAFCKTKPILRPRFANSKKRSQPGARNPEEVSE